MPLMKVLISQEKCKSTLCLSGLRLCLYKRSLGFCDLRLYLQLRLFLPFIYRYHISPKNNKGASGLTVPGTPLFYWFLYVLHYILRTDTLVFNYTFDSACKNVCNTQLLNLCTAFCIRYTVCEDHFCKS